LSAWFWLSLAILDAVGVIVVLSGGAVLGLYLHHARRAADRPQSPRASFRRPDPRHPLDCNPDASARLRDPVAVARAAYRQATPADVAVSERTDPAAG
jgi:hypothetical protein